MFKRLLTRRLDRILNRKLRHNGYHDVEKTLIIWPAHLFIFIFVLSLSPAYAVTTIKINHQFNLTNDFKEPSDVSVSQDGDIYVVDGVNNQIKVFNKSGEKRFAFGEKGSKDGQFRYPLGIDIGRSGNIYIADSGNSRIQIFNREALFLSSLALPEGETHPADPTDVAVDEANNRLYIVDNNNHRILAYDLATYALIKTIGSPGERELEFTYPFMIALNQGKYLHVVDVINTRVQVMNPEGLFVRVIGGWGVEKGHFFRPKGVAVDRNDRVYVSDSYMGVIQVFNPKGEFHAVLGDSKTGDVKKFRTPAGLFIDNQNRLYVVEMLAQKVSVYSIEDE